MKETEGASLGPTQAGTPIVLRCHPFFFSPGGEDKRGEERERERERVVRGSGRKAPGSESVVTGAPRTSPPLVGAVWTGQAERIRGGAVDSRLGLPATKSP